MKILLIEVFEVSDNLLTPDWLMQPLGLLYLGAALRQSGYNDVKIFDTRLHADPIAELKQHLTANKVDVVGLSSFSASASFFHEILAAIKNLNEKIVTVAGGPHANANPQDCLADENLDYIVLNEGEITFPEFLQTLENGGDMKNVKGLVFQEDGKPFFTDPRPFIRDLDTIPLPAWDLTDIAPFRQRYSDLSNNRLNYVQVRPDCMPLFTSRACPYNCIYCHKIFGKKFRAHSPERVLKEVDILYDDYGIRQFDFYDDIFNLNRDRTVEILKGIANRRREGKDIKLSFFNGIRGDIQDNILIKLFREAGAFMIPYAVETASPRLQKLIKKNIKLEKLKKIVSFTSRMNIITVGFAMLGFPTESEEEIYQTIDYMLSSDFDIVEFFVVSPYFGTELSRMLLEHHPHLSPKDIANMHYSKAKYSLSQVPPERLRELHLEAYRRQLSDRRRVDKLKWKIRFHREKWKPKKGRKVLL